MKMLKMVRSSVLVKLLAGAALMGMTSACGGGQAGGKEAAVAERPKVMTPAEQKFYAGLDEAAKENWQVAATLFSEASKLDPNLKSAVVNYGIALERSGDFKAASNVYREAWKADPNNPRAAANVARTLLAVDDLAGAGEVLAEALKNNPEHPSLLNTMAGILRQQKKYQPAAEMARKVLLRDQKNVAAIKTLALIYADEGKLQLAETFFRNALKLDEKDASIYVNLGLLAHRRGDHQVAMLSFDEALKLQPDNAVAMANIGSIALHFRDYARAVKNYKGAVDAGLVNCTTAPALGYAYEGVQDGQNAVAQLAKAHELCPKDHEILFAMGTICMGQLRDNDCALKHFESYSQRKENIAKDDRVFMYIKAIKDMKAAEQAAPATAPEEVPVEGGAEEPVNTAEPTPGNNEGTSTITGSRASERYGVSAYYASASR